MPLSCPWLSNCIGWSIPRFLYLSGQFFGSLVCMILVILCNSRALYPYDAHVHSYWLSLCLSWLRYCSRWACCCWWYFFLGMNDLMFAYFHISSFLIRPAFDVGVFIVSVAMVVHASAPSRLFKMSSIVCVIPFLTHIVFWKYLLIFFEISSNADLYSNTYLSCCKNILDSRWRFSLTLTTFLRSRILY